MAPKPQPLPINGQEGLGFARRWLDKSSSWHHFGSGWHHFGSGWRHFGAGSVSVMHEGERFRFCNVTKVKGFVSVISNWCNLSFL